VIEGALQCLFDEGSHPASRDTVAQERESRFFEFEVHENLG
jgi:hypothetical protein